MLEKGDKIGEYTLIKFLGRGQFGEVWLAEKQFKFASRKFRHALKFLSNRDDYIDLKSAEAEIDTWIEASGHPNIMPVTDMLVFRDYIIIISEFADGGSLNDWLKKNNGKAPTIERGLEMMIGILRGLEHLHSKSVVHRDLKPDNILLQGNFPRIADFGISRIISENTTATKAVGSPVFMSPEAFLGSKLPQTDIWSAGVILFQMVAGHYPFNGQTIFALRDSIQNEPPKPLPKNIPPDLQQIIEKSLHKDVFLRFQTAREMRVAVDEALLRHRKKSFKEKSLPIDLELFIPTDPMDKSDNFMKISDTRSECDVQLKPTDTFREIEAIAETQPSGNLESFRPLGTEQDLIFEELAEREKDTRLKRHSQQKRKLFLLFGGGGAGLFGLFALVLSGSLLIVNKPFNSITSNRNVQSKKNEKKAVKLQEGVIKELCEVFLGPGEDFGKIGELPKNSAIEILITKEDWYKIKILEVIQHSDLNQFQQGWVRKENVEIQKAENY